MFLWTPALKDSVMPFEIRDLDEGLGILIEAAGIITDDVYVEAHKKYLTQDNDKPIKYKYSLSDYTAVTNADTSTKAITLIGVVTPKRKQRSASRSGA